MDNLSYVIPLDNGGHKQLLHSVTATFPKGVVNVLMGHSGAGKVSLLYLLFVCAAATGGCVSLFLIHNNFYCRQL